MEYNATNPLPSLLKHFRKKAGLTQTDVATALSMSRSGYANYEEGRNIPNIEQTLQLSELLHHDLLYAYTLSSRYMRARSNRSRQMVMESDTYLSAIKTNENMAALMTNYQMLGTKDKMLVDKFVESLAAKTNKPTDITSDNEQT
jgi:transcriptional regulator with XRE-family HTH domain